jgi:hypothetical protein
MKVQTLLDPQFMINGTEQHPRKVKYRYPSEEQVTEGGAATPCGW